MRKKLEVLSGLLAQQLIVTHTSYCRYIKLPFTLGVPFCESKNYLKEEKKASHIPEKITFHKAYPLHELRRIKSNLALPNFKKFCIFFQDTIIVPIVWEANRSEC